MPSRLLKGQNEILCLNFNFCFCLYHNYWTTAMKTYYEDKYCKVTEVGIIIYKYYFPLATSRTILYADIEKITL